MRSLLRGALCGVVLGGLTVGVTTAQGHGGQPSAPSPYVEQLETGVRGLSEAEVRALLAGEGMGLARPAELNGYPGPLHVLELAEALALSDPQRAAVEALHGQMLQEARAAGAALLARYAELEAAFRAGTITTESLALHTAEVGRLEGELRAVHLKYHLLTAPLLSAAQRASYARLRGYTGESAPAAPSAHEQHAPGQSHGH
jgi:hypothetical protein